MLEFRFPTVSLQTRFIAGIVALSLVCGATGVQGHEVDHYELPLSGELADQSEFWDQLLFTAIETGVNKVNERSKARPYLVGEERPPEATPEEVAREVRAALPNSITAIDQFEWRFHHGPAPNPGEVNAHFAPVMRSVYSRLPWIPDPRYLARVRILRSSIIKVHGHYIGTDKVCHFFGMGYLNYQRYQRARAAGQSQVEAQATAVGWNQYQAFSEKGICGAIPCGIYSNGDMAANYVGTKFYINLTEPVMIRGEIFPPMLEQQDGTWLIKPHVRPGSGYLGCFVSDHYDEALNPCIYEWTFREGLRKEVAARGERIVAWYSKNNPSALTPDYYDRKLAECQTYFGEDYGHQGSSDQLILISQTCFKGSAAQPVDPNGPSQDIPLMQARQTEPRRFW